MKNAVKIFFTLGIVISFFPVYPMDIEESTTNFSYPSLTLDELKNADPLRDMNEIVFKKRARFGSSHSMSMPKGFINEGLAFKLAVIRVLEGEFHKKKQDQALKAISAAVALGIPLVSQHTIEYFFPAPWISIKSNVDSFSIFEVIKIGLLRYRKISV